jgi:hypothetical protein
MRSDRPGKEGQILEVKKRYYTRIMDLYRYSGISIPFVPTLIRTAFRFKVAKDRFKLRVFSQANQSEIREWFQSHSVFFGFGLYRSGTTFLANFLSEVIPDAVIEQEAHVDDYWYYFRALQSEEEARKYIVEFRLAEIRQRMQHRPATLYGEINPFLRRHCRALQAELPRAKFFHVTRDGRNVVRSILSREILGPADPLGHLYHPPPGDFYASRWKKMSRFERVCWLWQCDNRYLRESIGKTLPFERLITDWDFFQRDFADFLGICVPREAWQAYSGRVGNPTQVFRKGQWSTWSSSEKETFIHICGEEMEACGYKME